MNERDLARYPKIIRSYEPAKTVGELMAQAESIELKYEALGTSYAELKALYDAAMRWQVIAGADHAELRRIAAELAWAATPDAADDDATLTRIKRAIDAYNAFTQRTP